jgi:GT2 family glycosyltransferase
MKDPVKPVMCAVLITVHNRCDITLRCLKALYACCKPENFTLKIFLVDDASKDNTATEIACHYPDVYVIKGSGSLYWNGGMRLAWKTAAMENTFDFFLWLNDDTLLQERALRIFFEESLIHNHKAIIVGVTHSPGSLVPTYGGYINEEKRPLEPIGIPQKCSYFNGNCIWIPLVVFNRLGYLDKYFTHSLGDFDYGVRAVKNKISSFTTGSFVGECELNTKIPEWTNSNLSLIERIRKLYSPLGCNPFEFFYFTQRKSNIVIAALHFVALHLRVLFPLLWKKEASDQFSKKAIN